MPLPRRLRWPLLATLSALASCTFDANIPEGARVTCGADSECPPGYRCRPKVGCVARDAADVDPPAVLGLALGRRLFRPGEMLALSFAASELLGALPEAWVVLPGTTERAPLALEATGEGGDQPGFRGGLDLPSPTADGLGTVHVLLVDRVGNSSTELALDTFAVDGTAPSVIPELTVALLSSAPTNPIAAPTALGPLVVADVAFFLDEAVPVDPGPSLRSEPGEISCTAPRADAPVNGQANAFRTRCTMPGATPPAVATGTWRLTARAADAAGNAREGELFAVRAVPYDAEPPPAPSPGDGGLVLERFPFGTVDSPVPGVRLVATAGVLHEGLVLLERAADGVELGRAAASLAMSFSLQVPGGDVERAQVRQVDGAGNSSAALVVPDYEWVGPVAGPFGPTQMFSRKLHRDRLQDERLEQNVTPALGAPARAVGAWTYRRLGPTALPELQYAAAAYDRRRDRALLFGGLASTAGGPQQLNDTLWELREGDWHPAVVVDDEGDGNPRARYAAAAVWVESQAAWYVYGGATDHGGTLSEYGGALADLWRFDGRSWRKLWEGSTADRGPGPRALAALGYDVARRRLVLAGGTPGGSSTGIIAPIWEWDGAAWSSRNPTGPQVVGPLGGAFFWDQAQQRLVLAWGWGGPGAGATTFPTALAWTGADWVADAAPPALTPGGFGVNSGAAVAYGADGRALLLGGEHRRRPTVSSFCPPPQTTCVVPGRRETSAETFRRLDDAGWEPLAPLPAPISYAASTWVATRGEVLLAGGASGNASGGGAVDLNVMLAKSATTFASTADGGWRARLAADAGFDVDVSAVAYASAAGGILATGNAGTLVYDGDLLVPAAGIPPAPCVNDRCHLDEDPSTGRLIGLRAGDSACLELSPGAAAWTSCGTFPGGASWPQALAFDHASGLFRAVAMLFTGFGPPETSLWALADAGWAATTPPTPLGCELSTGFGFAWHPQRAALHLACPGGGGGTLESRFVTSGTVGPRSSLPATYGWPHPWPVTDWSARATIAPAAPGPAVFDSAADGGLRALPYFDEEDDGEPRDQSTSSLAAHDPTRQETLLMHWPNGGPAGAWALRGSANHPSLVLRADVSSARLPSGAEVLWVRAAMEAGATSRDALGAARDGARLAAWVDGWRLLAAGTAANTAPPNSPAPLSVEVPGGGGLPAVAVFPTGVNGEGVAEVVARRAELRVRYRLALP